MNRDGRVVIRPDSGDPVDILVGNKFPRPKFYSKNFTFSVIFIRNREFGDLKMSLFSAEMR